MFFIGVVIGSRVEENDEQKTRETEKKKRSRSLTETKRMISAIADLFLTDTFRSWAGFVFLFWC